jgi:hypothetical protein
LTERNEHLDLLSYQLAPHIQNLIVLRGGMSAKEIAQISSRLATIPENEERVLLATDGQSKHHSRLIRLGKVIMQQVLSV